MTACRCQFCAAPLDPAQEFRFLVESQTLANPGMLARIRRLPATADGRPLRVCGGCQAAVEARARVVRAAARPFRAGVLAAAGLLSAGWFLGVVFGGPRA